VEPLRGAIHRSIVEISADDTCKLHISRLCRARHNVPFCEIASNRDHYLFRKRWPISRMRLLYLDPLYPATVSFTLAQRGERNHRTRVTIREIFLATQFQMFSSSSKTCWFTSTAVPVTPSSPNLSRDSTVSSESLIVAETSQSPCSSMLSLADACAYGGSELTLLLASVLQKGSTRRNTGRAQSSGLLQERLSPLSAFRHRALGSKSIR